ncbi:MAG: Fis family transcriptional regulator [Desulfuromonas sp.]|nr:MAG: Fis family transcriptional regulator [Desulfuromonas sp.]
MNETRGNMEHCEAILDSVADCVFTVDNEMRITSFNRAAEELTLFERSEVIGHPCHEVFRSNLCDTACPIRQALKDDKPITELEMQIKDRRGQKIDVSISASVLRDKNGVAVGGVETMRDISQFLSLKREVSNMFSFEDMISRNDAMQHLFDVVQDVAYSDATILVQGESGTGKELVARAIHNLSSRKDKPLVTINCGALPEPLLEAEIFGAKRGAYTGAVENRPGRLEMAEGGTLFLDEIGDLPLPLQVKLLRVLENREFQPLGAKSPQTADIRFVTATHRNIAQMVEEGTFRRDLFFRINVVSLQIPPLRRRKEDIPLLLDFAVDKFNRKYGKRVRGFSPEAMQILVEHDYPGNVRELLNLVEQVVILCHSAEIEAEHLPITLQQNEYTPDPTTRSRKRPNRETLLRVLEKHEGNRNLAAQEFNVDRTTLWRWMKRHNI